MTARGPIRLGDYTTGGGKVRICSQSNFYLDRGIPGAVYGDLADCPKHGGGLFSFVEADHSTTYHGLGVVLEGHKLACGCHAISSASGHHVVTPTTPELAKEQAESAYAEQPASRVAAASHHTPAFGAATSSEPTHVLVALRIGVFFDGTGNNAMNSAIAEQCREKSLSPALLESMRQCSPQRLAQISYGNEPSNVARLFNLYPNDLEGTTEVVPGERYLALYVDGIGTTGGESDSILRGVAQGLGDTGVAKRVEQTFYERLPTVLRSFVDRHPQLWVESIVFDVFGFSRGAAAARHFVFEIQRKAMGALGTAIPAAHVKLKPRFNWISDVRVDFLGLFETVLNTGSPQTGEVGRAEVSDVHLALTGSSARKVIELRGRDEHRLNFPLTSVQPTFQDISLPGVHSDIGGGYQSQMIEHQAMSKPFYSQELPFVKNEDSTAWKRAAEELVRLQAKDLIEPGHGRLWIDVADDAKTSTTNSKGSLMRWRTGGSRRNVFATVMMEREVKGAYSMVTLRIMRELAIQAGVPFVDIDAADPAYQLPQELAVIADKLLAYASGASSSLDPAEERLLRRNYLHQSANWDTFVGGPDVFYVNRPANGDKRVIYANTGGELTS